MPPLVDGELVVGSRGVVVVFDLVVCPAATPDDEEACVGSERPGVGSKGTNPDPGSHASTQACASRSSTT